MSNNLIWPTPEGEIAIVCCSPNNLHTIQYDKVSKCPTQYTLVTEPEEKLNVFTEGIFKEVADCGFNAVMYPGSDLEKDWIKYTSDALVECEKCGIKLIVDSPILNFQYIPGDKVYKKDWPKSFVEQFVNHPALGGWMVKDEPKYEDWNDLFHSNLTTVISRATDSSFNSSDNLQLTSNIKPLIRNHTTISQLDSRHIIYMNLAANEHSQWIGNHRNYEDYLDQYVEKFNPPLLTFDLYPITCTEYDNGVILHHIDTFNYFKYLNIFSEKSNQSGIPFWSYCLCLAHNTGGANYPAPTVGMLRFEAFASLAFGAKGLVFWGFKQDYKVYRKDAEGNTIPPRIVENGGEAPLTLYGEKTEIWCYVKSIIAEVKAENGFFYNSRTVDYIRVEGNSIAPTNGYGALKDIRAYGRGLLITKIEKPNPDSDSASVPTYIMIVNCDPFNEQKIGLHFVIETNNTPNTGNTNPVDTNMYPLNPNDDGNYDGSNYWQEETLKPGGFYRYRIY